MSAFFENTGKSTRNTASRLSPAEGPGAQRAHRGDPQAAAWPWGAGGCHLVELRADTRRLGCWALEQHQPHGRGRRTLAPTHLLTQQIGSTTVWTGASLINPKRMRSEQITCRAHSLLMGNPWPPRVCTCGQQDSPLGPADGPTTPPGATTSQDPVPRTPAVRGQMQLCVSSQA